MNTKDKIKISKAKGRPFLQWVGKKPLDYVTPLPAQKIETFNPSNGDDKPNLLFHGDNKEVLAYLIANGYRGKIDLIYIDPPFDSGADYVRKVQLRGNAEKKKIEGETYTLGEQIQYTDIWANDNYLQFMYERLLLLKELLSNEGTIWVHCDWHKSHYIKMLLEEIFGQENFLNEVIWKRKQATSYASKKFGIANDTLLWVAKGAKFTFIPEYSFNDPNTKKYIKERYRFKTKDGRIYKLGDIGNPEYRPNLIYDYKGFKPPANGWAVSYKKMCQMDKENRLEFPKNKSGRIMRRQFLDEYQGQLVQNLWLDIPIVNSQALERLNFPTQKPEALLKRLFLSSSNPCDIILDCFIGSGTTAAVAQKLGRRWIGCDINKGAIQTTGKRLQKIIMEQIIESKKPKQIKLKVGEDDTKEVRPASFSFDVYRVNDYDLQIQHDEAVNLACERIGITRKKNRYIF